jgi:DNA-binding Lrp family transcriptional regulator
MKKSIGKLNKNETKFLEYLLDDGHSTDSEIALKISLSKASVGRIRKKLESQKILADYIPIIDLDKFGVKLFSVVMFQWTSFSDNEKTRRMEKEFISTPHVVYFAGGESSNNLNYVAVLGFTDLTDYNAFFDEFRKKYSSSIGRLETFFIPSNKILKQDFTDLAKFVVRGELK